MNASWLGLVELCLVFGVVGFFCWRELASHRRWKASKEQQRTDTDREGRDTDAS